MAGVLEVARALAPSVPVVLMCYANMVFAPGAEAFVRAAGADRGVWADRARSAAGGGARGAARPAMRTASRWCRSWRRRRRRSAWRRSARSARGFLYTVSVVGTTGERERWRSASPRSSPGRRRAPRCRWRSASGSARPSRRAQAADAGADGVIVGHAPGACGGRAEDRRRAAVGERCVARTVPRACAAGPR